MLHKLKNRKQEGFTIIEVLIVLAIAGLILLIVFLAVPALQRNSRNTQMKNDASHLGSLISEFQSNNGGTLPTAVAFSGSPTATQVDATKEKFSILTTTSTLTLTATVPGSAPAPDVAALISSATCNGAVAQTGGTARQVVVYFGIEPTGKSGCITVD